MEPILNQAFFEFFFSFMETPKYIKDFEGSTLVYDYFQSEIRGPKF